VSDIVTRGEMPEEIRRQVLLWSGCIAGALQDTEYQSKLAAAGFEDIGIEPTRMYTGDDAREFLSGKNLNIDVDQIAPYIDGKFMSAFVRAKKPMSGTGCCSPTCCGS
jgi:arsenite methyltransferase